MRKSSTQQSKMPKLRFPEFSGEWRYITLGKLASEHNAGIYKKAELYGEGSNIIGVGDLYSINSIDGQEFRKVPLNNQELKQFSLNEGDLLYGESSIVREGIAKTLYTTKRGAGTVFAWHTRRVKIDSIKILPEYAYYFLGTRIARKHILSVATQTSLTGITTKDYFATPIYYPDSRNEQKKIADFLKSIDEFISILDIQKIKLLEYKRGMMQKIFSQEVRFKDENGKNFPDWQRMKMSSCLTERNEKAPKSDQYPLMAFVAYKGVAPKGDRYNREFLVNDRDSKQYKKTEYGDFIYSSNNLETGSIGLNLYGPASISPVYSIFCIKESCDYRYMNAYLIQKSFIHQMTRYRQGVIYGQWRIRESDFLKIEGNIPCLQEQKKIANFLASIDNLIKAKSGQIKKAEIWKRGLLQKMFV